jgi:hypothetical protein
LQFEILEKQQQQQQQQQTHFNQQHYHQQHKKKPNSSTTTTHTHKPHRTVHPRTIETNGLWLQLQQTQVAQPGAQMPVKCQVLVPEYKINGL